MTKEKNEACGKRLLIIGSGELGRQIAHFADVSGQYTPVGFADDYSVGKTIMDLPVICNVNDIESVYGKNRFDYLVIAIGYKYLPEKSELYNRFKNKIPFATIIVEPRYIDSSSEIGEGTVIYPGVIIDKNVKIGPNNLINLQNTISHDTVINESNFLAPGVTIAGFCKIGSRSMIGLGANIRDSIEICDRVCIGMGSVVTKSISEQGTYYGSPAKFITSEFRMC